MVGTVPPTRGLLARQQPARAHNGGLDLAAPHRASAITACPITCASKMGQPAHHPPLLALVPGHGWNRPTDTGAANMPTARPRAPFRWASLHRTAIAILTWPDHLSRTRSAGAPPASQARPCKLRAYPLVIHACLPKQAAPRPPQNNDVRPSRAPTKPSPGAAHIHQTVPNNEHPLIHRSHLYARDQSKETNWSRTSASSAWCRLRHKWRARRAQTS